MVLNMQFRLQLLLMLSITYQFNSDIHYFFFIIYFINANYNFLLEAKKIFYY